MPTAPVPSKMSLLTCSSCGGLSPHTHTTCVHCDAALRAPRFARIRTVGRALAAGGVLVTLMACYGMAPRHGMYADNCQSDSDGDTVCAPQDCDDAKPEVYPGAADPDLDGIDQNCDGVDGWRDPANVAVDPPAPQSITPPAEPAPASP